MARVLNILHKKMVLFWRYNWVRLLLDLIMPKEHVYDIECGCAVFVLRLAEFRIGPLAVRWADPVTRVV